MKIATVKNRKLLGTVLVAMQFACLLLLAALALPAATMGNIPPSSVLAGAASLALALWILMHNRLGNFNIQPIPKPQGALVTTGPYRWVRHPMYTALLLGAAALVPLIGMAFGWGLWCCLALVLWTKSLFEEQWMQELHPGYRAYMLTSKRFVPLVF